MNDSKRNGPEFAPIRNYVKQFKIIVDIYDKDDADKLIRSERMDYGIQEDRLWLGKLSFWAWENGHVVETRKDDDS